MEYSQKAEFASIHLLNFPVLLANLFMLDIAERKMDDSPTNFLKCNIYFFGIFGFNGYGSLQIGKLDSVKIILGFWTKMNIFSILSFC